MKEPAIVFKDFSFQYKVQNQPTLHDINLTIYKGEKVLILGSSGSGKSTLANCINGLIPFSHHGTIEGSVTVLGKETRESSIYELSKSVGTVLQDSDAQFVGLSVEEDIAFAMENEAVAREKMVPIVKEHAMTVGMEDFLNAVPFNLSGGQKQKVAIAGVLGTDVNILIFDEPLAALDPQMGNTAVELIDELAKERERTIIIIEHRLEDVLHRNVDRIILMADGTIAADMTPEELIKSDLLKKHGIREPLYITAMKYAGCSLEGTENLGDINTIRFSDEARAKLTSFFTEESAPLPESSTEEAIGFDHVTFAYDTGKSVVKDASFSVKKGERIAIIGKNGAGKSTAAKIICGVVRPQEGTVRICGKDAKTLSIKEIGERVGYVMQNPNQMIIKDTIKKEVEYALNVRSTAQETVREKATAALNACSLYPMRNWPVDTVSYGQKKRVTVASILVLEPDVLILDEPSAGQDYKSYTEIMRFINVLNREYGKTILFITHDMHLALENTERAIVFSDGEVIADDKVFSVLANDSVIQRANLKQTSLYTLAQHLGLEPEQVIRRFIAHEREVRKHE